MGHQLRYIWQRRSDVETHPNYLMYARWIHKDSFGWGVDLADHQYRSFRENVPLIFIGLTLYSVAAHLVPVARLPLGLVFVFVLHGTNSVTILVVLAISYGLSFMGSLTPILTWVYAIAVLFVTEWYGLPSPGGWTGLYPRWSTIFKVPLLRLISFNLDYHWRNKDRLSHHQKKCRECTGATLCRKGQAMRAPHSGAFNLAAFAEYVLYPPLYIAGPILSFNSFHAQQASMHRQWKRIMLYGLRLLFSYAFIELFMRSFWVVAIKDGHAFNNLSPLELFSVAFVNLFMIWLKLMIIWRTFRLLAMLDGIWTPENMLRCMTNNYSLLSFWRQWHHSFNQWITR